MERAQVRWWVAGDWDAFFGLGTNSILNILVLTGLLLFLIEMPKRMILGAVGAFLIDREFKGAAGYALAAAVLAFFGFIHGSKLGWAEAPQVALGYLFLGVVCYLIPKLARTKTG